MRIILTVTNDLTYDQRMHRICSTLAEHGHLVTLLGRALQGSIPLEEKPFRQKRLHCFFQKGFLFYAEYNIRVFLFLLFAPYDAVCSIDLDTLSAGFLASKIRRKKRVFDAHEYFTEVPEVANRPAVKFFWGMVAHICLPFYRYAYTVGSALAKVFEEQYGLEFGVVRNVPVLEPAASAAGYKSTVTKLSKFSNRQPELDGSATKVAGTDPFCLLYQGALNAGRGIETMLEAMQSLENVQLVLAGEGDLSAQLRQKALDLGLGDRVVFLGYIKPDDLKNLTAQAWLGLNLLESRGLSYHYSLANKFFDAVQAGVPVLTMDFPEYRALNEQYQVALLLKELTSESVSAAIQILVGDKDLYKKLQLNCIEARNEWNWEREQKTLMEIWRQVEEKN